MGVLDDLKQLSPAYQIYQRVVKPVAGALDPSKGYEDAAKGVKGVSDQFDQLSEEQWAKFLEGLGYGRAEIEGLRGLWASLYGSGEPGAMEKGFSTYGGKFFDPTNLSKMLPDYQQKLGQPSEIEKLYPDATKQLSQPGETRNAYDRASDYVQGPTQSQKYAPGALAKLEAPSKSSTTFADLDKFYSAPGMAERFGQDAWAKLGTEGTYEKWARENQGRYDSPSRMTENYDWLRSSYQDKSRSEQGADKTMADMDAFAARMQGPSKVDTEYGNVKNYITGATDASDYAKRQLPGVEREGLHEQFARSAVEGRNPYFERERQKGMEALNQQMAKRGHFNSGGAMAAMGNYLGELGAREYQYRGDLTKSAQELGLQRVQAGAGIADTSGRSKLSQAGALQGLTVASEQAAQARLDQELKARRMQMDAQEQADRQRMARLQGLQGAATATDQSELAKLTAGERAQQEAQAAKLARLRGAGEIVDRAQGRELQRHGQRMEGAGQVDRVDLDRTKTGLDISQAVDKATLERALGVYGMGEGVEKMDLAKLGMRGDFAGKVDDTTRRNMEFLASLAGKVDDQTLEGLKAYYGAAAGAQGAEGQRKRDTFGAHSDISRTLAELYASMYGKGVEVSGESKTNSLNALANSLGLGAQGGASRLEALLKFLGIVAQNAGTGASIAIKGGK